MGSYARQMSVLIPLALWLGCSPELAQRTCEQDSDCGENEFCNAGSLCQQRPPAVGEDARADGSIDVPSDVLEDVVADPGESSDDLGIEDVVDSSGEEDIVDADSGLPDAEEEAGDLISDEVSTGCGPCSDGVWGDNPDAGEDLCIGYTPPNACGGCATLVARLGNSCGECDDGVWVCETEEGLTCLDPSRRNLCGGCGVLEHEIGAPCGCSGGDATWECSEDGAAVECVGDASLNACGGCAALEHEPGEICSCDGLGMARYVCETPDSLVCTDGDDGRESPRLYENWVNVSDDDLSPISGWIDGPTDQDWYNINWLNDDSGAELYRISATLTVAEHEDIDYELCLFYVPSLLCLCNLATNMYTCEQDSSCAVYRGAPAADVVALAEDEEGVCGARGDFDLTADVYGCCDSNDDGDNIWEVELANHEVPSRPDRKVDGVPLVFVRPLRNDIEGGCHQYSLKITANTEEP